MKESHQACDLAPPPEHWVCPFCGLLCDDLHVPVTHESLQRACPKAARDWMTLQTSGSACVDGMPVSEETAVQAVAEALVKARRPLIGGLAGDVQMMRAALDLADCCGARVMHAHQAAMQRNLFALQSRGAVTTTLGEARNRADLVVVVGSDVTRRYPRVMERIFAPDPAFVDPAERHLALLGVDELAYPPVKVPVEQIECDGLDLFWVVAALRACIEDRVAEQAVPKSLVALAERMRSSRYGLLLWAAGDFEGSHVDLLVEQLQQLLQALNRQTRWAAIPLAGSGGDLTANAVATWQTGFSLPLEFRDGEVTGDPFPDYSDIDLLLWIAMLPGPAFPEWAHKVPTIGIGAPGLAPPETRIFLPAAVPGVGVAGHLVRTDGVVTLYAPPLCDSRQSPSASLLGRILNALEKRC